MAAIRPDSSTLGRLMLTGIGGVSLCFLAGGCGDAGSGGADNQTTSASTEATRSQDSDRAAATDSPATNQTPGAPESSADSLSDPLPITLGALGGGSNTQQANDNADSENGQTRIASVIDALKPLQTMLGAWRGTTRMEYDGMKAVDAHEWVWDLTTDPERPALTLKSDNSPYVREARITLNPDDGKYVLTTTDPEGIAHQFTGHFDEPVEEYEGDDRKMHRRFRLLFTESGETAAKEQWQIAWAQQTNNRYLLEVDRKRGTAPFRRYDTVSTQREGTSFAADDSDYGERECIISQGLGTTAIAYKGKTYWVCCSGCKAAFEDDPEKWLALAAKRKAEEK